MTPQELKNSILQLAIQGKLVEQRAEEGTGKELMEKILAAKNAKGAKGREIKHTRSRGVRGGSEDEGISNLPKATKSHHGKLSALSASPREEIPDDEKPFDIPESWEWVRLESIINSVPTKQYQVLESEVCSSGRFAVISQSKEYSIGFTDKSDKVYRHTNPVIVFGDHTAEVKYVEFDFVVGADGVKVFEPKDSLITAKLLFYILQHYSCDLSKVGGYSRHYKFLKNKLIPLPPLAEQKRIVAKIEELMPLVERYEKAWSKLKDFNKRFPVDMQKSLLQMAIQGKLVEQRAEEGTGRELLEKILAAKNAKNAKGREIKLTRSRGVRGDSEDEGISNLPKAAKSHHGKLSALSASPREEIPDDEKPFDIPESWEWVRVGDVCTNIQYGSSKKSASTGSVPVLRMGNIQNGKIDYSKLVFTSDEDEIRKYALEGDDLLFNRTNSKELVGKVAIYKGEQPAIYAGYLVRITPVNISADYLNYVMQSQYYWEYCQSVRSDAIGQSNINAEKLKRFVFPLPPLAEQKRIVAKLEELLPLCERLK